MFEKAKPLFEAALEKISQAGLSKQERPLQSPQAASIYIQGRKILNLCSNNYLGLANDPDLISAAKKALETRGYGMASVRFICGTQDLHQALEKQISAFLETDATLLYSSCFDANTGLFETLFGEEDAILSDVLNHASIIDGIRLCKAARYRFKHLDMLDLKRQLQEARKHRLRVIATDGVFSMDGEIAPLSQICDLAKKYEALVMVDDSHATGLMGTGGRGTMEHCGVLGRVDLITSTLGKAMGGASGGFTSGRRELINLLCQRSRPYLFSNALPPMIVAAAQTAFERIAAGSDLRNRLWRNTRFFRTELTRIGFRIKAGSHPIIPVLLGDPMLAREMASDLFEKGIYTVPFSYPVVPRGEDRIRIQITAAHIKKDLSDALEKFKAVGHQLNILS